MNVRYQLKTMEHITDIMQFGKLIAHEKCEEKAIKFMIQPILYLK
jgi:hypothetical protein